MEIERQLSVLKLAPQNDFRSDFGLWLAKTRGRSLRSIMTDRFYLGLAMALGVFTLIFLIGPRLRLWSRQSKREKLEAWFEAGPKLDTSDESKSGIICGFCGYHSVKKTLIGSYPRKELVRQIEHREVDEARFFEYRCLKCDSLLYKEKLDLFDQMSSPIFYQSGSEFDQAKQWFVSGVDAMRRESYEEAEISFQRSLALVPDRPSTLANLAAACIKLQKFEPALEAAFRSVAIDQNNPEAWLNCGLASVHLGKHGEAVGFYQRAINTNPNYADAYVNLGAALQELGKLDEALSNLDKAIALNPHFAEAYSNKGVVLRLMKRMEEALVNYDKAISLNPNHAEAYVNRGTVLRDMGKPIEAFESYRHAWLIKPGMKYLLGDMVHAQMQLCDWSGLNESIQNIKAGIFKGDYDASPFTLLGLIDDPALQLKATNLYVEDKFRLKQTTDVLPVKKAGRKIRVAYYSADFFNHATSFLMAELFEAHDANRFEIYGFSFGPDVQDEMKQRVSRAFPGFFEVGNKTDQEIARMSREMEIDIAVDLKGYTQDMRTGIFAARCAPIQVNYLGYPGSMGASFIDYVVADETLVPKDYQHFYSEKIVYMPHSYQVNDSGRKISDRNFTRSELGLPPTGFVFCCFNNNYKILPATFESWMRLLAAVDGSVLWLLEDNPAAAANLRRHAIADGVDADRLVFAKRVKLDEHLARHRLADLFLDTVPYNAHTTASDALWAGLPVLTLIGQSFQARVAASLLNAMDLPELITETQEQYVARAIELATDPLRLHAIKEKVGRNRLTSPLFDGKLFARHLEAAYAAMHQRYTAGEPPDHIYVKDSTVRVTYA